MSLFGLSHKFGKRQIGIGACHYVYGIFLNQFLLDAFGHATNHAYECLFAAAHCVELVESAVYLLLGIVAYRAGVKQYEVGALYVVACFVAGHAHYRAYHFAVCHVHLAAVCLYE